MRECWRSHSRSVSRALTSRAIVIVKSSFSPAGIQLRTRASSGTSAAGTGPQTSGTIRLCKRAACSISSAQNDERTDSGLITNTNASLDSIARRSASGKTSASRIPSTSTHTSLPCSCNAEVSRRTNSPSRRE
jgi:hypothetical protein